MHKRPVQLSQAAIAVAGCHGNGQDKLVGQEDVRQGIEDGCSPLPFSICFKIRGSTSEPGHLNFLAIWHLVEPQYQEM